MTRQLSDAAVELIAALPDDAGHLTPSQFDRLHALHHEIIETMGTEPELGDGPPDRLLNAEARAAIAAAGRRWLGRGAGGSSCAVTGRSAPDSPCCWGSPCRPSQA